MITIVSVNVISDREKSIPVRRFGVRRTEEIRPSDNHRRSGINDVTIIYPSCSYRLWIISSKFFGVWGETLRKYWQLLKLIMKMFTNNFR